MIAEFLNPVAHKVGSGSGKKLQRRSPCLGGSAIRHSGREPRENALGQHIDLCVRVRIDGVLDHLHDLGTVEILLFGDHPSRPKQHLLMVTGDEFSGLRVCLVRRCLR